MSFQWQLIFDERNSEAISGRKAIAVGSFSVAEFQKIIFRRQVVLPAKSIHRFYSAAVGPIRHSAAWLFRQLDILPNKARFYLLFKSGKKSV
jgi:hypothetical protein